MKKRVLSLVLVLVLAIGFLPTISVANAATAGKCGDNLVWRLDGTVLTISGTGKMNDYSYDMDSFDYESVLPWGENITKVIIKDGVTSIGEGAFAFCMNLTSVTIPATVKSIGAEAFSGCMTLASITLPEGVVSIGEGAFGSCMTLASIKIPNSVKVIAPAAFAGCMTLKSITIPNGVKTIDEGTFALCTSLASVTIPNTVTAIGDGAFGLCPSLVSVAIPNGVKTIGNSAFSLCTGLKSVTIPASVTSIGVGAFSLCSNLSSINIDVNNKYYVFENNALFNKNKTLLHTYIPVKTDTKYIVPNGVKVIAHFAFADAFNITSIAIPASVTKIGLCGLESVKGVVYGGSKADREDVEIDEFNEALLNAKWIYKGKFDDVKTNSWYKEYVDYVVKNKIFEGTGKNKFSPNDSITRAQFVQVFANLEGVDTKNKNVTTKFSDVTANKWFSPAVKWASENGVVNGYLDGTFKPNESITREQMCIMLVNYADYKKITLKKVNAKNKFADDSKIGSWAKDAVYKCQMADIVNGMGDNKFEPKATGTRAQACVIFTKFHKYYLAK